MRNRLLTTAFVLSGLLLVILVGNFTVAALSSEPQQIGGSFNYLPLVVQQMQGIITPTGPTDPTAVAATQTALVATAGRVATQTAVAATITAIFATSTPTLTRTPTATRTATGTPTSTGTATNTPTITPTRDPAQCDPSYPTVCIPPPPPDLNCSDIPHRNFVVLPPDPHGFDTDNDGIGCEQN